MNVFEFLGLDPCHRPKNKVVQLVKNWAEVPASRINYPYIGQVKKDGVFAMLVCFGDKRGIFSRTGGMLTSCDVILNNPDLMQLSDGVYIGELLSRYPCSLEQLSGTVSSERVNPLGELQVSIANELYIAWHDFIYLEGFRIGQSASCYSLRWARLNHEMLHLDIEKDVLGYVRIYDEEAKDTFTESCIAAGEEGAVYKNVTATYVAGHKGFHQIKEVRGVSYDLLCVGYEEGAGKYEGKVANLIFKWKGGETIKAMLGKGWSHDDAAVLYRAIHNENTALTPIGKIFKVTALQESSKGKLRLPKVREVRYDKYTPDY